MTPRRDFIRHQPQRGPELPAWLERLVSVGIVASDPDVVRRQRCVNVAAFALVANAASHLAINAFYDLRGLVLIHVYNAAMIIAALAIPRLHRFGENVGAVVLTILVLVGNSFVVWALGTGSNLHVYFTLAGAMLLMLGIQNWRTFLIFFALSLACLLFALNFVPPDGFIFPDQVKLREMLSSHAMVNTITINAVIIFYALATLRRAELELQDQYARSEALVSAVMPAPIAERVKQGEPRIADRIETLTVMFADLVDFTGAAHALTPDEVVDFLDRLVRSFDALCEQHGVDKIKTIGDSYMAASGFDGRARDGAVAVGRLALALLDAIGRQAPLGERRLQLRIGIHCGAATAGIIGDTRFSYDVWGDAVNTASRMESYGQPGRIQVSEAFREKAAGAFVFEAGGVADIKGIGMTSTYFLIAEQRPSTN